MSQDTPLALNGLNNFLSHLNQSRDSFSSFEIMFFLEKSMNSIEFN